MAVAKYELTEQAQQYVNELEELNAHPHTLEDEKEFNAHLIERAYIYGKKRPVGETIDWENNLYEQMLNEGVRVTPGSLLGS